MLVSRVMLKWILKEIEWEGLNVIRLSQNTDTWRAAVGTSVNLRGSHNAGNLFGCERSTGS